MPTLPVLKRFDMTVYKNKDGSDPAQVAAEAKIEFYRQGATVKTGVTVSSSAIVVTVFNTGDILTGHTVQLGTDESKTMTVGPVNEAAGTIELQSTGADRVLAVGDRLVDRTIPPSIYANPLGEGTGATSVTTDSVTGRYGGYIKAYRYDFIVKIPPTSPTELRLYIDCVGSFVMR